MTPPWADWAPASCLPHCFCEAVHDGWIAQPANTFSNLGFVLVGTLIIIRGLRGGRGQRNAFDALFGGAVIFLGVGSAMLHASLTLVGQWFDVMSMYLIPAYWIAVDGVEMTGAVGGLAVPAYLALVAASGALSWIVPETRRWIFGALVVILLLMEVVLQRRLRRRGAAKRHAAWLAASVVTLAASWGVWKLDETGKFCTPDSWLQGHAIWHVGCALAVGFLYLYYRSTDRSSGPAGKNLPSRPADSTVEG